jgi:hypothetical protein
MARVSDTKSTDIPHDSPSFRQGKYGENMAASIAADTDPVRTATGLWIGESKDYDYNNPTGRELTSGLVETRTGISN